MSTERIHILVGQHSLCGERFDAWPDGDTWASPEMIRDVPKDAKFVYVGGLIIDDRRVCPSCASQFGLLHARRWRGA